MKKIVFFTIILLFLFACAYESRKTSQEGTPEILTTNFESNGYEIQLEFTKGKEHNYPLMAIWLEDMDGNYVQTLYVAKSVAKAYFRHGDRSSGRWMPGPIRRPAALPYWAHKRGVQESDGLFVPTQETAIPDALTGATPQGNFVLKTKTDDKDLSSFKILFEINQSWDWNRYWNNSKYPFDNDYKSSSQPALVYEAIINSENPNQEIELKLIGHSHYAGRTGELFTDVSTITSALDITKRISVKLIN
ncbi:MAG: hypothetical protein PHT69_04780 [Bacteroidales bacterium]|nr:hypothetical protein [Bacteroidales bacterium]